MVRPSAGRVDEAARYAGDEELVLDLELDDVVEFLLSVREHRVELLSLGDGTREPVKDETTIGLKKKTTRQEACHCSKVPRGENVNGVSKGRNRLTRARSLGCCRGGP